MDSKDFLTRMKEVKEIGKIHGKQGGGAGFVTQIEICFGFWAYGGAEHDRLKFWKRCENDTAAEVIKAEVQARLDQAGVKEEADWCIRIFADKNVLGRDPFEYDSNAFYPSWQWEPKKDGPETCVSLILDQIEKNGLPLEKLFWGRYQLKSNPYHVAQGESAKKAPKNDPDGTKYWPNFVLPVEKFSNEQAAKAAAGGSGPTGNADSKWSDLARANYIDLSVLEGFANEIIEWLGKAEKGIPYVNDGKSYPLLQPFTPPRAKAYIANIYDCAPEDIDLLIPF